MARYVYRCPDCRYQLESTMRELYWLCPSCVEDEDSEIVIMKRDYRAESVGIGSGVRVSRDGTVRDQADLFLPSKRDFAEPGDPDGSKGLRHWNETHDPAPGNTNPIRPRS